MAKNKITPHANTNLNQKNLKSKQMFKKKSDQNLNSNYNIYNGGKVQKKYKNNKNKVVNGVAETSQQQQPANENKKNFNKKLWRLKKYSKKYKLEQWQENRKKAMLREYYKELKNDADNSQKKFDVQKIYEQYSSDDESLDNQKSTKNSKSINYVLHPKLLEEKLSKNKSGGDADNDENKSKKSPQKLSAYKRAQLEYERIQNEKKRKRDEYLKQKAEKEEALKKYKKNKLEKYKKLNKKTKKGQPVMKGRIELLLEKIQSTTV